MKKKKKKRFPLFRYYSAGSYCTTTDDPSSRDNKSFEGTEKRGGFRRNCPLGRGNVTKPPFAQRQYVMVDDDAIEEQTKFGIPILKINTRVSDRSGNVRECTRDELRSSHSILRDGPRITIFAIL